MGVRKILELNWVKEAFWRDYLSLSEMICCRSVRLSFQATSGWASEGPRKAEPAGAAGKRQSQTMPRRHGWDRRKWSASPLGLAHHQGGHLLGRDVVISQADATSPARIPPEREESTLQEELLFSQSLQHKLPRASLVTLSAPSPSPYRQIGPGTFAEKTAEATGYDRSDDRPLGRGDKPTCPAGGVIRDVGGGVFANPCTLGFMIE